MVEEFINLTTENNMPEYQTSEQKALSKLTVPASVPRPQPARPEPAPTVEVKNDEVKVSMPVEEVKTSMPVEEVKEEQPISISEGKVNIQDTRSKSRKQRNKKPKDEFRISDL